MTRIAGKTTESMSGSAACTACASAPHTIADTGLPRTLIIELLAKVMYSAGTCSLDALGQTLALPVTVLLEALGFMVEEQLALVARRGAGYVDVDYQLTGTGRERAAAFLLRCRYAGPAPVTLDAYRAMVLRQSVRLNRVSPQELDAALSDLVLSHALREQLGSAMNAGRSLLLYGPPGSGKSTLARKLGELMHGQVYIPHAVLVDNEIIVLYDPLLHHRRPPPAQAASPYLRESAGDARWVHCLRPVVHAGGELTRDLLGLRFDASAGYYQAPPHLKANNGIFIVDDLDNQHLPLRELANRWLAPLDRGCDRLSLHTGYQFGAPFDVALVLASCADPAELADATVMQRMTYKVHLGAMSETQYRTIARRQCSELGVAYDEAAFRYLLGQLHQNSGKPLLPAYPRDLLALIADHARYTQQPAVMSPHTLARAWHSYFAVGSSAPDGHLAPDESDEPLHLVGREGIA